MTSYLLLGTEAFSKQHFPRTVDLFFCHEISTMWLFLALLHVSANKWSCTSKYHEVCCWYGMSYQTPMGGVSFLVELGLTIWEDCHVQEGFSEKLIQRKCPHVNSVFYLFQDEELLVTPIHWRLQVEQRRYLDNKDTAGYILTNDWICCWVYVWFCSSEGKLLGNHLVCYEALSEGNMSFCWKLCSGDVDDMCCKLMLLKMFQHRCKWVVPTTRESVK